MPQATSVSLAAQLLGRFTSVTQAVQHAENPAVSRRFQIYRL
jgi:hypothetical protein